MKSPYFFRRNFNNIGTSYLFRQIIAATGPVFMQMGISTTQGYSAIMLPQLELENDMIEVDSDLASWIASMSALPMAGGAILGGYSMVKIGRRSTHILSCLPFFIGCILIAAAPNPGCILAGRFLSGLSNGFLGPVSGVYIAEMSDPHIRGILLMIISVADNVGIGLVHLLGTFLHWRLTAWICGVICIPFAILMMFVPESPNFLAKIGKIEEAKEAFYWSRGKSADAQKELDELINRQQELNNAPKISLTQQLKKFSVPEFWKPTLIVSVLFFSSQITGKNAIASYTIQIMDQCGFDGEIFDEYFSMIAIDLFGIIASIVSCFLINKMTRRGLTKLGGFGVTVSLTLLCSYLYLAPMVGFNSQLILLGIFLAYMFIVSIGLVPLSWTIMGELFPSAHRGAGTGITSSVCFSILYLVVFTFPHLLTFFGNIAGVFVFYGVCTTAGTIYLVIYLPETKDVPLYVIEDYFKPEKSVHEKYHDRGLQRN